MKKNLLIIGAVIATLVIGICVTNLILVLNNKAPIISLKTSTKYQDSGKIIEYNQLGYKVYYYDMPYKKGYTLSFYGSKIPMPGAKNTFKIVDKTTNCPQAYYYFYEDSEYRYYFTCLKKVYLKFANNLEIELETALNYKLVTMADLNNDKIDFKKELK